MPRGTEVAAYKDHEAAQKAVEKLGDEGFPLNAVTIAGSDLHTIEQVLGKISAARVAGQGALQGLVWGFLMGFLAMVSVPDGGVAVALVAVLIGVLIGVTVNSVAWALSSKKQPFRSRMSLVAARYAVLVTEQADRAHALLDGSPGKLPPAGTPTPGSELRRPPRRSPSEPPKYGVRTTNAAPSGGSASGDSASGGPAPKEAGTDYSRFGAPESTRPDSDA